MAIENFAEVSAYLEANKDSEDVKNYVGGFVTSDRVNSFLESDDGKKLLQPKLDSYHGKSLKTWQDNNLNNLVSAKVKELHPDIDPKDTQLAQLQAQFDDMKNATAKEKLTNKTLKQFSELKLPNELVDFVVSADEESTAKNIKMLTKLFATHDEAIRTEFAKGTSYTPPNNKGNVGGDEKLRDRIRNSMK